MPVSIPEHESAAPVGPGQRATEAAVGQGGAAPSPMLGLATAMLGSRALQRRLLQRRALARESAEPTLEKAAAGVEGAGRALPHGDAIQSSFGQHRVGDIQAHVGGSAAAAAESIGAEAYATGNQVAFRSAPDLHTAAHEAAHVVQQRAGVHLQGGVGEAGDSYEQHADAVADRVVSGQSAEALLSEMAGGEAQPAGGVQRKEISETTDTGNTYKQEMQILPSKIQIQLGIKWIKKGTWTDDNASHTFIRSVKAAVYSYLDNKFKVVGTPNPAVLAMFPTLGAFLEPFARPIDFLVYDSDTGHPVNVWGGTHGRSAMSSTGGDLYELGQATESALPAITSAHEFGHALLGASDEYANPAVPARVLTSDHSIMANFYSEGVAQAQFKPRHFQHILDEVGKAFPGHTCKLKQV